MMKFVLLVLSIIILTVYGLPQERLSKNIDFNDGKSSAGLTIGYNKQQGFGLGAQGSHNFEQGTKISGSVYGSQHGGTEKAIGVSQNFGQGTSISGSHESKSGGQRNTFGASHNVGQGTSFDASHSKTSFDNGFSVTDTNIGVSHKTDYGTFGVKAGHNSETGTSASAGGSWGWKRKRRQVIDDVEDKEEEEHDNEEFYI